MLRCAPAASWGGLRGSPAPLQAAASCFSSRPASLQMSLPSALYARQFAHTCAPTPAAGVSAHNASLVATGFQAV